MKDVGRNLDMAARKNEALRKDLKEQFEDPFYQGKASYAREVRERLADLKETMDALGIKKGTKESAAIQWVGEGQKQDKYGELHPYTREDLKREFPEKHQDIIAAEQYSRKVYDEYITRINETLMNIYPDALERAREDLVLHRDASVYYREQIRTQKKLLAEIHEKIEEKKILWTKKKDGTRVKADLANSILYNRRGAENVKRRIKRYEELAERHFHTAVSCISPQLYWQISAPDGRFHALSLENVR